VISAVLQLALDLPDSIATELGLADQKYLGSPSSPRGRAQRPGPAPRCGAD